LCANRPLQNDPRDGQHSGVLSWKLVNSVPPPPKIDRVFGHRGHHPVATLVVGDDEPDVGS